MPPFGTKGSQVQILSPRPIQGRGFADGLSGKRDESVRHEAIEAEILREVGSFGIEPPLPLSLEHVEGPRLVTLPGGGHEVQLRIGAGRSKRVATLEPSKAQPVIEGVVRSPFEPRVAIIVSYDREDGFERRDYAAFGAHLTAGFGD